MKKIIAVVLTFAMLMSTFAMMNSGVNAGVIKKKGFYYAVIQQKKTPWGYVKKVVIENYKNPTTKKVTPTTKAPEVTTEPSTEEATTGDIPENNEHLNAANKEIKITTYGTFMYRKKDRGRSKTLKKKARTFIVSTKCKFYDRCWVGKKKKKISRGKALNYLSKVPKHNAYGCEFKVKGGKVVVMKFGKG